MTTGAAPLGPLHRNGSAYPSRWEPDPFSFHHLTRAQTQQSSSNKGNAPALPQTDGACLGTERSHFLGGLSGKAGRNAKELVRHMVGVNLAGTSPPGRRLTEEWSLEGGVTWAH